ncbi:MAG: hypothetical protein ACOCWD_00165 [Tangfeifania sp.]
MKTEKAMKTKITRRASATLRGNNVQKAVLRTIAVIISFVLISYTVSAQEFWKKLLTNSSFNEIAIAMTKTYAETVSSAISNGMNSTRFYYENATEPAMEVESWMTNENTFSVFSLNIENEVEIPLAVENWMLDTNTFENDNSQEENLEMENRMTSTEVWDV